MNNQASTAEVGTLIRRQDPFPRLVDWFEGWWPAELGPRWEHLRSMRVEEFTRDGAFVVRAELPGIDPGKDVEVTVSEGMLTIRGERREEHVQERRSEFSYGSFLRTLPLPRGADASSVHATYQDGILEVTIALPASSPEATKVPITWSEHREAELKESKRQES